MYSQESGTLYASCILNLVISILNLVICILNLVICILNLVICILNLVIYPKPCHILIKFFAHIYMSAMAGQTAGPNGLTFFKGTRGYPAGNIGF